MLLEVWKAVDGNLYPSIIKTAHPSSLTILSNEANQPANSSRISLINFQNKTIQNDAIFFRLLLFYCGGR